MKVERLSTQATNSFGFQNHAHGKSMFMNWKKKPAMRALLNSHFTKMAEACLEFRLYQKVPHLSKTEYLFAKRIEASEMMD